MANHDFSSKVENLKDYPINFATETKAEFKAKYDGFVKAHEF